MSRSLVIWALRLGFTGSGGGGMLFGVSRERRERWRVFSCESSESSCGGEGDGWVMPLLEGSRWRGYWVKTSIADMVVV